MLRKALEKGDDAAAIASLNEYLDAYAGGDGSIRQMIYNNVTSVLLAAFYEVNLNIPRDFLRGGYESRPLLDGWVTSLCSTCASRRSDSCTKLEKRF